MKSKKDRKVDAIHDLSVKAKHNIKQNKITDEEMWCLKKMISKKLKLPPHVSVGLPDFQDKTSIKKIKAEHGVTVYILNYIILTDTKTHKTILTIRMNEYKEFSILVPKVRKIDKIYVIKRFKPVVKRKHRLNPIVLSRKVLDDEKNKAIINRGNNYTKYELRDFRNLIECTYELDHENYEIMEIIISSKPCYVMKELKEKLFYSDCIMKDINEWITSQKENSK